MPVSFLLLSAGVEDEDETPEDEGDREDLTHVEEEVALEGLLVILDELKDETREEDYLQEYA